MDVDGARTKLVGDRPRRLRLSELLAELGALADDPPPQDSAGRERKLLVGELIDKAAEGGFGFVIGILALIAIPFFGLSTPFGLAIALIGGQMMIGRSQPWLPRRARRRELSMAMLDRVATMLARRTRWIVKLTRRRSEGLLQPRLIGFGILLLALGLALPLPIPGSNLVFLIPIFIYALGILERDGVWIAVGHACVLVDLALMFVFGKTIAMVVGKLVAWIF
ncbi:MAG: exopolysaccharide biosynthesis protein [Deltaproteobacteria bacterium]|nr:exopolysaccharide biosynthesis protein [Deltaproteobacteria bacterium]